MISATHSLVSRRLRVLLAGSAGAAGSALSAWLSEGGMLEIAGPAKTVADALESAASFHPDVVLLDFHGLPASLRDTVSQFKKQSPPPLVLVLTHEPGVTMRHRCYRARVDEVFDKTAELEALAALLAKTRRSLPASSAGLPADRVPARDRPTLVKS